MMLMGQRDEAVVIARQGLADAESIGDLCSRFCAFARCQRARHVVLLLNGPFFSQRSACDHEIAIGNFLSNCLDA